ncbi:MAG: hypothetical protein KC736_04200 [Candidatus Moranbacteria bacterium]|nr:hypothetical protein [Candidatus Moranbacteria bacterium]
MKRFLIFLVVCFVGVFVYIVWNVFSDRYFGENTEEELNNQSSDSLIENVPPTDSDRQNLSDDLSSATAETDASQETNSTIEETSFDRAPLYDITTEDCEEECPNIDNASRKNYCENICGLIPIDTYEETERECENFSGVERDYCLRDIAVSEKDPSICEEISDKNVFLQCKNRILEDIVDESF